MRRITPALVLALAALASPGLAVGPAAAAPSAAAPGTQLWVRTYNGPANGDDIASSAAVSPSGGTVYVTGASYDGTATGYDYRTVAYSAATGARLWTATYNGPGNSSDRAYAVAVSPDGAAVFVTGASAGAHSGFDYATVAYRAATGARLWVHRYNGPGNSDDEVRAVAVSPGSHTVYVTGWSRGTSVFGYATVAYSASNGAQLWVKRYNSPAGGDSHAYSLAVGPGGGTVYVTGNSAAANSAYDYVTVAYNAATGAQHWVRRYNGPGNGTDIPGSLAVSPDGAAVYVTGQSTGSGTSYDYATIAYNAATGAQLWLRRYNSAANGDDLARSVAVSPDGGTVYVTGWSTGAPQPSYLTVAYRAATGTQLWAQPYTSTAKSGEGATSVAVSPDGAAVYVTGWTVTSSGWAYGTVAYSAGTGAQRWAHVRLASEGLSYGPSLVVSQATGTVFVAGTTAVAGGPGDFVTVAYSG